MRREPEAAAWPPSSTVERRDWRLGEIWPMLPSLLQLLGGCADGVCEEAAAVSDALEAIGPQALQMVPPLGHHP